MQQMIGRGLERAGDLDAEYEDPGTGLRIGQEGGEGFARRVIGIALGDDHGVDRLQRGDRVGALALGQARGRVEGADELPHAVGRDVGEMGKGCHAEGRRFGIRHEADQKRAFLQRVGRIVDLVDHRAQHAGLTDMRLDIAGGDGQPIGLLLDAFGATRECLPLGCRRCRRHCEHAGDPFGQHARQAQVPDEHGEHRALGRLEAAREIGLNLVADQPRRAAGGKALARIAQHMAQERLAFVRAEGCVEPHAVRDAPGCHPVDRLEDQVDATQIDEGPMAQVTLRRPGQQGDRRILSDEGLERLARLVPIDQEYDAGAEKLQEAIERFVIGAGAAAGQEMEDILAETLGPLLRQRAPGHILTLEQRQ